MMLFPDVLFIGNFPYVQTNWKQEMLALQNIFLKPI